MKFELKTENENYSKSFLDVFRTVLNLALIIFLCDISLKLGIISRIYQIEYSCNLLSLEQSSSNFKKLSKLLNFKTKQRIWEFCRNVVK
tara:strand:+ start:186 stop:452 length:267 start_codon:yes stop_codon:yes gene_type:complete